MTKTNPICIEEPLTPLGGFGNPTSWANRKLPNLSSNAPLLLMPPLRTRNVQSNHVKPRRVETAYKARIVHFRHASTMDI